MRWLLALAASFTIAGCPSSHEDDTGPDVAPFDAGSDTGTPLDAGLDAPSDVPADVARDTRIDVAPDGGTDLDAPLTGMPLAYVISLLDVPEAMGDVAPGFDLDGMVSSGATTRCDDALDYTSPSGAVGVDNQYSSLAGLVSSMLPGGFVGAFGDRFAAGDDLIVIELVGVDSYTTDPMVMIRLHSVATESGARPRLGGDGRLAAGQRFVSRTVIATSTAQIVTGRLVSGTGLSLPLRTDATGPFDVREARLAARIGAPSLTMGEIGGHQTIGDLLAAIVMLGLPIDEATLRSFIQFDMMPADPAGNECNAVSLGMTFEAISAVLVTP